MHYIVVKSSDCTGIDCTVPIRTIVTNSHARIDLALPRLALVTTEEERERRLAYWIRQLRLDIPGLTPPKVAKVVGVAASTVNAWEKGRQVPSMIWLGGLTKALRVDPKIFAELPPIPPNAAAAYLVDVTLEDAVEEGRRRASRDDEVQPSPKRSRRRPPHGGGPGRP